MASVVGCKIGLNELFNALGCGGGATLFVDNIDQLDDAAAWLTLRDLLRAMLECPGWRAVFLSAPTTRNWREPAGRATAGALYDNSHRAAVGRGSERIVRRQSGAQCLARAQSSSARDGAGIFSTYPDWWIWRPAKRWCSRTRSISRGHGRVSAAAVRRLEYSERLKLLRSLGECVIRQPGLPSFPPTS